MSQVFAVFRLRPDERGQDGGDRLQVEEDRPPEGVQGEVGPEQRRVGCPGQVEDGEAGHREELQEAQILGTRAGKGNQYESMRT